MCEYFLHVPLNWGKERRAWGSGRGHGQRKGGATCCANNFNEPQLGAGAGHVRERLEVDYKKL